MFADLGPLPARTIGQERFKSPRLPADENRWTHFSFCLRGPWHVVRVGCWMLVLASVCWLGQTAMAQAIIRPREFSLIRPTFLPPKPNVMAAINIKPIKQQTIVSTNNNPKPTVFPSLRLTSVVRQGISRQNVNFAAQLYQPRAWAGATPVVRPGSASPGANHASLASGSAASGATVSPSAASSSAASGAGARRPALDW